MAFPFVTGGRDLEVAWQRTTTQPMPAQAAETKVMEPKLVLEARRLKALTPYPPQAWHEALEKFDLSCRYPHIPGCLETRFSGGIPSITHMYTPPNHESVTVHAEAIQKIINTEFTKGRFIGPFTAKDLESIIGPFQTSPLSIIPKPGKPGKFRLIQNLSHPINPLRHISSINSRVDSDLFPCTYGTFATICQRMRSLPPGSQAAVRDVAEAYRTIPLHHSQWPGLAVRLPGADSFAVDTTFCFGFGPSAGTYGNVADAGADILRAIGLGPLSKWVDDHIFFRILREFLDEYNTRREKWAAKIASNGGAIIEGGRKWYGGETLPDDSSEEFDEDCAFPIRDFSTLSPRTEEDARFSCCMADIDHFSIPLGITWEISKDKPFGPIPTFTGLLWDIPSQSIALPPEKTAKYLAAINTWQAKRTHTLPEVQKLYGKLLHATLVVPSGRAYLTSLESMLGIFKDRPFLPRTPPISTQKDLEWWKETLSAPHPSRTIPGFCIVHEFHAYSDASSGHGIGIVINERWRAWNLLPGWKGNGRDIGWAESVGFELLVLSIIRACPPGIYFKVYGDNRGVVEGWWTGRSRSKACNEVFKRIHLAANEAKCTILTRYVPSKDNPADGPSRGIYPPTCQMLPPVPIPHELRTFIADVPSSGTNPKAQCPKPAHQQVHPMVKEHLPEELQRRAFLNRELERRGEELFETSKD
jgi:hypothetical protein